MKRTISFFTLLVVMVALVSGCGLSGLGLPVLVPQPQQPAAAPTITLVPEPAGSAPSGSVGQIGALETALESVYQLENPSVVHIEVTQTVAASGISGFPFGLPENQGPQTRQGLGSGFVWDSNGHIVTNNHVVANADTIRVTFADGTSANAQVVGADPDSDLAVLKVDTSPDRLHPVQLADSTQVKIGQIVIAIGNPFGLDGTMTVGFVSSTGRSLPVEGASTASVGSYSIPDIIQTDAAINPGNSGGVLLDERGNVIGVTSAIVSPIGASAGIGFAIPSVIAAKVVPALIATGHYEHPYIGITGGTLTSEIATAMNLHVGQHGALIVEVTPGGPADEAGLRGSDREAQIEGQAVPVGGDTVTAIEGTPVSRFEDLTTYLARYSEVGQTISLTILRDGKEQAVDVTLAARPGQGSEAAAAYLGVEVMTLNPLIAEASGLPANQEGVLVGGVMQGSPAEKAGLRGSYKLAQIQGRGVEAGGDVIVAANGQSINQASDLQALLQRSKPGDIISFTVLRDGQQVEISVTLGTQP